MTEPQFTYRCTLDRVVDGDTIVVNVDLGFGTWVHDAYLRLYGINTPELRGDERDAGLAAKQFVIDRIGHDVFIVIDTIKSNNKGKYGRYLAIVWYLDGAEMRNLNQELLDNGHAVEVSY